MKQIKCATYEGLDAKVVYMEVTLTKGLPSFSIVTGGVKIGSKKTA